MPVQFLDPAARRAQPRVLKNAHALRGGEPKKRACKPGRRAQSVPERSIETPGRAASGVAPGRSVEEMSA